MAVSSKFRRKRCNESFIVKGKFDEIINMGELRVKDGIKWYKWYKSVEEDGARSEA